jgi:hypothetical protein
LKHINTFFNYPYRREHSPTAGSFDKIGPCILIIAYL